jgi:hypothetical protein
VLLSDEPAGGDLRSSRSPTTSIGSAEYAEIDTEVLFKVLFAAMSRVLLGLFVEDGAV